MTSLLVAAGVLLSAGAGWAQTPNDNFSDAISLQGPSGTITGNNDSATLETGEPLIGNAPGGGSIWYAWTAPANGAYSFNTFGSVVSDTVLGVFTGTSVTDLTVVAENDDADPINNLLTSRVTFVANAGTTYYIKIDSFDATSETGDLTLNWGAESAFSGDFSFTSQLYLYGDHELDGRLAGRMEDASPPANRARITFTRRLGYSGRVLIDYTITNLMYTNYFVTNVFGTNIFTTNVTGLGTFFTNLTTTNVAWTNFYQNCEYGQFGYFARPGAYVQSCTNGYLGGPNPGSVCVTAPITPPTNYFCGNFSVSTNFLVTNGNAVSMMFITTNVFCTNYFAVSNVPTAMPPGPLTAGDYTPVQATATNDDYQMSLDIPVRFSPVSFVPVSGLSAPVTIYDPPVNRVLIATIDQVYLDPLESTDIPQPIADPSLGPTETLINILNMNAQGGTNEVSNEGRVVPIGQIVVLRDSQGRAFRDNNGDPVRPFQIAPGAGIVGTNTFNFERAVNRCNERVNGFGSARVYVVRSGNNFNTSASVNYRINYDFANHTSANDLFRHSVFDWTDPEIPLQAGSDYATADDSAYPSPSPVDFTNVSGTLTFPPFVAALPIDIPINNDSVTEFNEDLLLQLWDPSRDVNAMSLGYLRDSILTIQFDAAEQPAGACDVTYNPDHNSGTTPPYNELPGANSTVYAIALQSTDGKAIVGGDFSAYNTVPRNRLARVNTDGSIDTSFNPGAGADRFVTSLLVDPAGKIVVGGGFNSMVGVARKGIARLNSDGSLDGTFNPGLGASDTVNAIARQSDGSIVVAGKFTTFSGTNRAFIARVNANGVLDPTFGSGFGPNDQIQSIALQLDGRIVIGGDFTMVSGVPRSHIARLNIDGSLDTTFNPGNGADGIVYSVAVQNDGKILFGGAFNFVRGINYKNICRLNSDGSMDLGFDLGSGADDVVYSINLQGDGKAIIGGLFRNYNQTRRVGLARLYTDGTLDTTFMDCAYNQFAGLPNHYFDRSVEGPNFVLTTALQADGNLVIGGSFTNVGGGGTRDAISPRANVARVIGGATPGPGNIQLTQDSYTADENGGRLFVTMMRTNGHLGEAGVTIATQTLTPGPGAAVAGTVGGTNGDFFFDATTYGNPTWVSTYPGNGGTWEIQDGTFGQNQGFSDTVMPNLIFSYPNNDVYINVLDNNIVDGNRNLNLQLSVPQGSVQATFGPNLLGSFNSNFGFPPGLGGQNVPVGTALGRSQASMTIVDNDSFRGVISFAVSNYFVGEATKFATISVIRTNGSAGTVQVNYSTADGTAKTPADYFPASGTLTMGPGVTNGVFQVQIVNDTISEDDETILLTLSAASGGASLGLTNAVLTIIDNDSPNGRLNFASSAFATNENAGSAIITVNRSGGSQGTLNVSFATSNLTATAGIDYTGVTNTLTWNPGDAAPKTFSILLHDDQLVNGNRTVGLALFGATVNGIASTNIIGGISNSVLTIKDDDAYGFVAFSQPVYNVNENGGPATVTVTRTAGIAQGVTMNFATGGGTAVPGIDYSPTNGVLLFAPGEISKSFTVAITDNFSQNTSGIPVLTVGLTLSNITPGGSQGSPVTAVLNIVDDELVNQPAGSADTSVDPNLGVNGNVFAIGLQPNGQIVVAGDFTEVNNITRNRIARLNSNGSFDSLFSYPSGGLDAAVDALALQSDGRMIIGGLFTNVNGTVNNHIARLNYNGAIDSLFNLGAGADNVVQAVAETFMADGTRRILIGGSFNTYNTVSRPAIARLNDDGTLDTGFTVGAGANGAVYAILPYPTNSVRAGQVLIAGDFTSYNGTARARIARLNADGSVDAFFDPVAGAEAAIRALALQTDEKIVVGGLFTNFNGVVVNHVTRLNPDGSRDVTFNAGVGANDAVLAMAMQPDGRILLGGQFTKANGITRHSITRLNSDGSADPTINFGLGADSFVAALAVQPDSKILLGGGFTEYDGEPHNHFVRIYGGAINGSGTFEFDSANYTANENGSNAVVTIRRRGGTSGFPSGNVSVTMTTSNGTAIAGVNYTAVITNVAFPPGEILANIAIPVTDDFLVNSDRTVNLSLSNPQPSGSPSAGAPALGNQGSAVLTIINDDSAISFSSATYSVNENTSLGAAVIQFVRSGSTNLPATVDFVTTTNGTAVAGVNYLPTSNTVTFAVGQTNALLLLPVLYDQTAQGNRTVTMQLSNVVGAILLDPSAAVLTILDVEHLPGQFVFTTNAYSVGENNGGAAITVLRTNGSSGVVTVHFATTNATALAGVDYVTTNGTLSFADGEVSKTFTVPVIDNHTVQGPRSLNILLTNPTGGTSLIDTNALLTILDDDVGIGFASPVYSVNEGAGSVTLSILRLNGSNGVVSVQYASSNGLATAGSDYSAVGGTVTFGNGETLKTITVPILQDNLIEGDETFSVSLFNIQPPLAAQYVTTNASVTIIDDDVGFTFTNAVYTVVESTTNLQVTVIRTNASAIGTNTVNYFTTDGSATKGQDYLPTSGSLVFTNGETAKTILVPILDDTAVEGDEFFTLSLANAGGGAQLVGQTNVTIQILDNDSGLSFASPNFSVGEGGVATITVQRTGVLTNIVSVTYATSDGTATSVQDYVTTTGSLTFTNGEVSKTFTVPTVDDNVVEGDETVLLTLSNPGGQASVVSPGAAVLTIVDNDGSLIVPAGSALTSETGPVNGVIDPGETVSLLFGLRNSLGNATANLTATLLTTNGVTAPSGPQNYGVLVPGGASASRAFTFTATGTNGGLLTATFQLQDGATNLGTAVFLYTIGNTTTRYTNTTAITIRDNTNALPYPSVIHVASLNGVVTKAAVTLTNLTHTHGSDVDALLTAAQGGGKMLLLANNGTNLPMSNVNLTFDDASATPVPISSAVVSGTNRPNPNLPVTSFPNPAPAGPYSSTLSACNGSNPNGDWSLFVIDDTPLDSGSIAGWVLSLTTASTVPGAANLVLSASATPAPVVVGSNVTYTIGVTNYGPSSANGISVTNILPAGMSFVSASVGGYVTNGGNLIFTNLGSLPKDGSLAITVVVNASTVGTFTNYISAGPFDGDPYTTDNAAPVVTSVVSPSADLGLAMSGAPSPVGVNNNLVYTLTVTNLGPATAINTTLTNTLPAGVTFVSASPVGYVLAGNVLTFTNLGNMTSGAQLTATITVKPTAAGTITNSASVGSSLTDPLKANNSASVKIIVDGLRLTALRTGNTLAISWPSSAGSGYTLEAASSLQAPITWTAVTNPPAQLIGGAWTISVGTTNSSRFFRLRPTGP